MVMQGSVLGAATNAKVFVNDEEVVYAQNPQDRGKGTQNIIITFGEEQQ